MNSAERCQLLETLRRRCDAIADSWHKAIARTGFVPLSATEVRQHLVELTEQIITLLLAEPFERGRAEAIGASLASLHYIEPEALGKTQEVLAHRLVEGLPADQAVALQPRLAALIGGMATGFLQQAHTTLLTEQEQIRSALVTELQRTAETLREHAERLRILHDIDNAILSAHSVEEIAQAALRRIRQLVPCQRASIGLFDLEASEVVLLAAHGRGQAMPGERERFSLDAGWFDELRHGEVYMVKSLPNFPEQSPTMQALQDEGLRSCACMPLIAQGELIGSLNLWTESPGSFVLEHADIAWEVANSLAIAIQQARLYDSIRQQGQQLRALTVRLAEAEESERQRLARELHDQVGKNLTALGINLNLVRAHISEDTPDVARSRLDDSLALVEETVERIRDVMTDLRPPMLDDYGLVATLHWYGERFASWTGVTVTVQGEEPVPRLAAPVENALFRIAQEVLTNVAKHARATQVTMTLTADDEATRLVVADDGVGFDPAQLTTLDGRRGWGLITMTERAEAVGGRCHIESRPQQGTRVIVEVAR